MEYIFRVNLIKDINVNIFLKTWLNLEEFDLFLGVRVSKLARKKRAKQTCTVRAYRDDRF